MKSAVFVSGSASYTVNGEQKTSDAAPFIDKNGRTQLPVRAVAEAFGALVGWDPATQTVYLN
ncbi:copper amine oxidase N-terminal domain-containing protein [Ammoniphilus sp. 3BR4]|uniref:copper amine oxidase N-terminal domain-containing protein n=1 Tax=Ammoniphilus sp. 3BR4 TaxID=3158265 RepID=UPI0034661AA3